MWMIEKKARTKFVSVFTMIYITFSIALHYIYITSKNLVSVTKEDLEVLESRMKKVHAFSKVLDLL